MNLRKTKTVPLMLFNICRCHTRTYIANISRPQLYNQTLERIKRYFEEHKPQIKNMLSGIGQPAKRERDKV